jgi:hypothetical protein
MTANDKKRTTKGRIAKRNGKKSTQNGRNKRGNKRKKEEKDG